jgi:glycine oxidase
MSKPSGPTPRVVIIGGGVIGLGIAWRLASRAAVTVLDRGAAGAGASHAAAGMLAACCEAEPGEEDLVALGRESQARWPAFADELGRASGIDVELRREGTLVLALTADDQADIGHRLEFQQHKLDLPLQWLSTADTRAREPHLAGKIAGAVFSPEDHQVDNRKLVQALRVAAERAGVAIHEHRPVKDISWRGGRAVGVVLEDGTAVPADMVVLAAGAWSRRIGGLPADRRPPVRPVKGQMLALQMDAAAPLLTHVLWAPGVYLVPRRDGRLIAGATVEEKGFDETITAGGLLTLLEAAWRAVPAIEELPVAEIWVGHRPGSRDDAPILGRGPLDGLFYATGHHRNGILLTPVTADAMARLILDDVIEPPIRPFGLERFLPARAAE